VRGAALPLDGICVFCHAPLDNHDEPIELLDYLVERIPQRQGQARHLNRGPISEVVVEVGDAPSARDGTGELEIHPPVLLTAWLDLLLTRLRRCGRRRRGSAPGGASLRLGPPLERQGQFALWPRGLTRAAALAAGGAKSSV